MNQLGLDRSVVFSAGVRVLMVVTFVLGNLVIAETSSAQDTVIVDMNFDGATGLENLGVAPNGVLKVGASIVPGQLVGQLHTSGANRPESIGGAGLDLPLGALSPFGGGGDFSLSFDFRTTDDLGVLFSADGTHNVLPDDLPGGQEGSLNIYLDDIGVFADFFFMGGVYAEPETGAANDGEWHTLLLEYDQSAETVSLTLDGVLGETTSLLLDRDASMDLTRLGDENNSDFGSEVNDGLIADFDNLLIVAGPRIPEPGSYGLLTLAACLLLGAKFRNRGV